MKLVVNPKRLARPLAALLTGVLAFAPAATAQRKIIGAPEEAPDAGPPAEEKKADKQEEKPAEKKDPKKEEKKDDKKDEKKDEKQAEKKDPKKEEKATKPDDKKAKKDAKQDILEDTPEEKARQKKDDEARAAAERAAEAAADAEKRKKEEEQKKLLEEKQAAEEKKRLENRDQRLAAARKVRNLSRSSGDVAISVAIEPGEVKAERLVEIRFDLGQKLTVPDPRYGLRMPLRGLTDLVASVSQPTGKKDVAAARYLVHPLEAPGRYGFHTTPLKDGLYQVLISGKAKDGKAFEASFPLHVGVWPPPDFEDEERNNLAATDAARAGRKILSN
jgi:murein DD-endopeptidase MepM/ murein hydrolase activator NlpD